MLVSLKVLVLSCTTSCSCVKKHRLATTRMLTGAENAMAGCCEILVGRSQLRGGSGGGGAGRLHPLHRALERADRPLVPRHAGTITINWNIKSSYVCLKSKSRSSLMFWPLFPGSLTSLLTPGGPKRSSGNLLHLKTHFSLATRLF